jgi:hypothetical protein
MILSLKIMACLAVIFLVACKMWRQASNPLERRLVVIVFCGVGVATLILAATQ